MEEDRKRFAGTRAPTSASDTGGPRAVEDSSFALLRDNVSEALRILMLRRWSFFIPFCLVTCLAAIASHRVKRTYESRTVIERRDHPVLMNLQQTAATGEFSLFFRPTLARDVRNLDAMARVVENLGLAGTLERNPDGTLTIESQRKCKRIGASLAAGVKVNLTQKGEHFDQIEISYAASDPNLPQKMVDQIKNVYIARTGERLTKMLEDVTEYFGRLARDQWERKGRLEEDLLSFQAEYIGVDPTDPGSLRLKLNSLESEHAELQRTIAGLEREVTMRRHLRERYMREATSRSAAASKADASPYVPVKSADALEIEKEIHDIQSTIRELQLTRRMTDRHPDIIEQRKRVARLQQRLRDQYKLDAARANPGDESGLSDEVASAAVDAATGWNAQTAALYLQIQDREARLAAAQQRLRVVERDITKHQNLMGNVFKYRKTYLFKKDNVEQALDEYHRATDRVAMAESILNADESERGITFTQITPPTPCIRPVRPRSTTVLALSLLVGLAAGAVCVLFKELFDHTYRTTKQVTRSLGIGILESIDEIVTRCDRARRFRRRVLYAPLAVTVLLGGVCLSCAAAYMSVEYPARYERIMRRPRSIWHRVHDKWLAGFVEPVAPTTQPAGDDTPPTAAPAVRNAAAATAATAPATARNGTAPPDATARHATTAESRTASQDAPIASR